MNPEQRLKLTQAVHSLYGEKTDPFDLKQEVWVALNGRHLLDQPWESNCGAGDAGHHRSTEMGKLFAAKSVDKLVERVRDWLEQGDADSLARFGRTAEQMSREEDPPRDWSEEGRFYFFFMADLDAGELPDRKSMKKNRFSDRTIQRCFQRISEESGLCLDPRNSESIWADPPS